MRLQRCCTSQRSHRCDAVCRAYVLEISVVNACAPVPSPNLLCARDTIAHSLLAALVALGDTRADDLYNRLRAAYNPFRPHGSLPVPPLEEWQGVASICEDFHCRYVGVCSHKNNFRCNVCTWPKPYTRGALTFVAVSGNWFQQRYAEPCVAHPRT